MKCVCLRLRYCVRHEYVSADQRGVLNAAHAVAVAVALAIVIVSLFNSLFFICCLYDIVIGFDFVFVFILVICTFAPMR